MYTISELEHLWIPVQIEDIEEVEYTRVVYPEDAVVVLRGTVRVIVEQRAEGRRPVRQVQLRVVPAPAEVRPRVL